MRRYSVTALAGLVAVSLGCAPLAAAAVEVFVSVLPQRDFVEQVAGNRVSVQVLVKPGQSPATYDPTPQQLVELDGAEVFFRIGVPFERSGMERIRRTHPDLQVVDLSEGLALRRMEDDGHGHIGDDGEPIDPHVWTSPPLVMKMVERIATALSRIDPAHAETYHRNAQAFIAELRSLDAEIRQTLAQGEGDAFLVYHPAWGYFADAYGLRQVAIESAGREPGPQQLTRTIERARAAGVRVIFVQPQFSRSNAEAVARAVGARVVTADPLAGDYLANMRRVAGAFAEALK